jgi:hypothetical protein
LHQTFPCPKCGAQIAIGQNFCGTCQQRFEYRCRHCGTTISNSSGFCTNCGGKLSHVPERTHPTAQKTAPPHPRQTVVAHHEVRQASQIGRYLIMVAVIFVLVGVIYAIGSSTQGASSTWLGGYSFGGQSPPSTPPVTNGVDSQQTPAASPAPNLPGYTVGDVIAAARKFSPDCQMMTRRTS